jgi:hypothetical protein
VQRDWGQVSTPRAMEGLYLWLSSFKGPASGEGFHAACVCVSHPMDESKRAKVRPRGGRGSSSFCHEPTPVLTKLLAQ